MKPGCGVWTACKTHYPKYLGIFFKAQLHSERNFLFYFQLVFRSMFFCGAATRQLFILFARSHGFALAKLFCIFNVTVKGFAARSAEGFWSFLHWLTGLFEFTRIKSAFRAGSKIRIFEGKVPATLDSHYHAQIRGNLSIFYDKCISIANELLAISFPAKSWVNMIIFYDL